MRAGGRGASRPPLPALQACPLDTMVWSSSRFSSAGGAQSFLCPPPHPPFLPAQPEAELKQPAKAPSSLTASERPWRPRPLSAQADPHTPQMLSGNTQPQPELLPTLNAGLSPSTCIGAGSRVTSVSTPVLSGFLEGLANFFCKGSDSKYFSLSFRDLNYLTASVLYCSLFLFVRPFRNIKTALSSRPVWPAGHSLLIHFGRSQAQIRMVHGQSGA